MRSENTLRSIHHRIIHIQKRADTTPSASCKTGGFYKAPALGGTFQSNVPLALTWDTTCLSPTPENVDVYLYCTTCQVANPRIHMWTGVPHAPGTYNLNLEERWWNATATVSLQVQVVNSGMAPFLSTLPAGPVFTVKYTKPSDGSTPASANLNTPADNGITQASNLSAAHTAKKLPGGKTAVAVLLPLLVVMIAIFFYLRYTRKKGIEKRKRWSEAVDKRMSTISSDWKSVTTAGANAAIRASMAVDPDRASRAFSFGAIRPASSYSTQDAGQAGIGSGEVGERQMSQLRPGARIATTTERVSRVSFADQPRVSGETSRSRPSGDSRRGNVPSRAFHSAYIPPLPEQEETAAESGLLSPTQTSGALPLTSEEIRARIDGEIGPALRMMRTGAPAHIEIPSPGDSDYLLFDAPGTPATPSTTLSAPPSALMPASPRSPDQSPTAMSPDALLRAYAEKGKAVGVSGTGPDALMKAYAERGAGFPSPPAASYHGGGMRVLYAPPTAPPSSPAPAPPAAAAAQGVVATGAPPMRRSPSLNLRAGTHRAVSVVGEEMDRYRKSMATSRYSGESFMEEEDEEDYESYIGKAE